MFLKYNILPASNKPLRQSLALALLLHIWLVLMFGNATGTARPGDGVWGRLNVTLAGNKGETGQAVAQLAPPLPELNTGPIGQAKQQRFGGTVRPLEDAAKMPPRPSTPGAAEVGRWQAERVEAPAATSAETPQPAPQTQLLAAPAALTAVARARPAAMAGLPAAPVLTPPPLDLLPAPQAQVKVMDSAPTVAVARAKSEVIGRVAKAATPVLEAATAPLPTLDPAAPEPSSKHLSAQPELLRQARSEVQVLAPTPLAPATAVAPLAALAASAVSAPSAPPAAASLATAASSMVPALPSPGAPEAGSRLGVDVATPASASAKPPPLNLNLPRPRGGELSSRGSSGVLQLLPAPPERKSKLSEDLEAAAKEDCRKAYGEQLGLLAVVPLVLDAAKSKGKGCRW